MSPYIQARLCEAISALLEDEDKESRARLSNFAHCLFVLDLYKNEIAPGLLEELHTIVNDYVETGDEGQLTFRLAEFSEKEQAELAERLLSIYINISGGNLVF